MLSTSVGPIGKRVQVALLDVIAGRRTESASTYVRPTHIRDLLPIDELLRAGTIVDFGCGNGTDTIALVQMGASRVIGVDSNPRRIEVARRAAADAGVHCEFVTELQPASADALISIDAMEHFSDPAAILKEWHRILKPGGRAYVSFAWTWLHPRGGHDFSVFPWAHLLFSEPALCEWRRRWHWDGARSFTEIDGGLNKITIAGFRRAVQDSPLTLQHLQLVPIRALRWLHRAATEEWTTAAIRAVLSTSPE